MSVSTRKEYSSIFYNNLGITRENLYDFSGELQISKTSFYPIACANFSGSIAEVLIWNLHETKCGYIVKVYSGSGKIISGYYWRTSFNLLSFDWVQNDTLFLKTGKCSVMEVEDTTFPEKYYIFRIYRFMVLRSITKVSWQQQGEVLS